MTLRLAFAVAAHLEPDVLFVDEVLAVGDAEFQKKCLEAMDDFRTGGRTVLFVSHNMSAIENLCPRAIWIEGGKIFRDGEAKDVVQSYLSLFADAKQIGHDLSKIQSRGGNGKVRFTGIEFLDPEGRPTNLVRSGGEVRMRLHFRAQEEIPQPHFGLMIYSDMGTLVTSFNTWAVGAEIPSIPPGEGAIDLKIDSLNLMPSRYYLTLWVGGIGAVKYDHLDHCVAVDVEASDPYGTGKGIERRFGVMYVTGEWTYDGVARGASG
jgi:hypothetical protein